MYFLFFHSLQATRELTQSSAHVFSVGHELSRELTLWELTQSPAHMFSVGPSSAPSSIAIAPAAFHTSISYHQHSQLVECCYASRKAGDSSRVACQQSAYRHARQGTRELPLRLSSVDTHHEAAPESLSSYLVALMPLMGLGSSEAASK